MTEGLSIEQRFALTRARYEVTRMSRPALEKTACACLSQGWSRRTEFKKH